jgi:hypothetical protein
MVSGFWDKSNRSDGMAFHPLVALSITERSAIRARMNASNIASLMDQQIAGRLYDDYGAAVERLRIKLGDAGKQVGAGSDPAIVLLGQIVDMLRAGRVTVNFNPMRWFQREVTFDTYGGMFELGSDTSHYAKERDTAEMNMFRYGSRSGVVGAQVNEAGVANVRNVGEKVYKPTAGGFLPGMRPKYGALDFNFHANGGAPILYGRSFFVLKEHMKMNATFTPGDSLGETGSDRVANIHNMFALVARAEDGVLEHYIKCATGQIPRGQLILRYTEAQLHADIAFRNDVAAVHVQSLGSAPPIVHENFDKFVRRFGLTVHAAPGDAPADI